MTKFGKSKSDENWLDNLDKIQDGARKNYFSVLPNEEELSKYFSGAFVINNPKGRVGGDGFWLHTSGSDIYLALFTCIGDGHLAHIMIRIYMEALRKMVDGYSIEFPGSILQFLHNEVLNKFKDKSNILLNTNANVGIVKVNLESKEIEFAGANMDLIQINQDGSIKTIDGVGKQVGETSDKMVSYPSIELDSVEESTFYMCSSGLFNLIGGPDFKKLNLGRISEFWSEQKGLEMSDQRIETEKFLTKWIGVNEQNDDVMVIGFKL